MASSGQLRIGTLSPSASGKVQLPHAWVKQLGAQPGRVRVAFGAIEIPATLEAIEGKGAQVQALVAPDVLQKLHLPLGRSLTVSYTGRVLRFGDVLGILADVKVRGGQVSGQQVPVFRLLLQAAQESGMYGYVFSPLDVDPEGGTAIGYALGRGGWRRMRLPLPDVVYDQVVSRAFENRAEVKAVRERLITMLGARFFNRGFFDKWRVHQWLAAHDSTALYMPDTIRYENIETAAEFLYRHPDVYMKPVHGSLGIGILRLRRRQDGRVYWQLKRQDGSLRQGQTGSVTQFLKLQHKRLKRGPYLIQQTLNLRAWQGRPFDIRLLLQKDGTGMWQRTKIFCRIAQEGEITSNLSTGGDALAIRGVLKDLLGSSKKVSAVMKQIIKAAEAVPAVVEASQEGTLGEIGLDLGLDEAGRVFVIEVNSKPWKKPNIDEGEWRDLAKLSFQRPIAYALFLCRLHRDSS